MPYFALKNPVGVHFSGKYGELHRYDLSQNPPLLP